MATELQALLDLLDLETIDPDLYRGVTSAGERERVYGGQVAAQALVAAGRTVPADRPVHSLHGYFMRPGDPSWPIIYDVDRLRDGRSFTTRRVRARQHGKAIFSLEASFQVVEPAELTHGPTRPDHVDPTSLPVMLPIGAEEGDTSRWGEITSLDVRAAEQPDRVADDEPFTFWFHPKGEVGEDPLLHAAVLTYVSDYALLGNVLRRHGRWFRDSDLMLASLDHAMWFHRPARVDGWMLHECTSPAAGGSRGLALGKIFGSDGGLACSTAQEGLVRIIEP